MTSRRAWFVWTVALVAYIVAVLHRTSLGVAGIEVTQRLSTTASILATFAVLQLLVYAAMQIPVGVILDRLGPKKMIIGGAVVMSLGQLTLALVDSVPGAMLARVLVGIGDATTFVSVLRVVAAWFPPKRVPLVTQLTGLIGQVGQILSAIPLVALLQQEGWETAFVSAAALGLVVAVLCVVALQDAPASGPSGGVPPPSPSMVDDVVSAWRHPGTRLGMWTHFATQFSGAVFALLWGFPFLVSAEGRSSAEASALLTVFVVAGVVVGPPIGVLVERHPLRRSWLVLGVIAVNVALWTAVLAWPTTAPTWLLLLLILALAMSGPGSMIGFDFARTFNPPNRLGTATGIVNIGGFVASLITIYLIGLVLDLRTGGSATYTLNDFRVAMSVQYLTWAVGIAGVLVTRRKARRRLEAAGVVVPPIRDAIARRRSMRRGG